MDQSIQDTTSSVTAELTHTSLMQQAGIAAIMIGIAIFLFIYALYAPKRKVDIQDPATVQTEQLGEEATLFNRYVRPMLRNFLPQSPMAALAKGRQLDKVRDLLQKSGNPWHIRAEEYYGIQVLFAAIGLVIGVFLWVFPIVPMVPPVLWILLVPLMLAFVPYSYHNTRRIKRSDEVQRQLPEAIDLLVITMKAGNTFEPAFTEVTKALTPGLLKEEFMRIDKSLAAGSDMDTVLIDFAQRTSSEDAEQFARAIVRAKKLGTDVSETLQNQARAARAAYENRIEKKIARLDTTMMMPLVLTMLPAMIIVVGAPALSTIQGGLL